VTNGQAVDRQLKAKRPKPCRNISGCPRWTLHDLRRTAATKLSELGCPDEIIDAILNHAKKGVIGIYNRNKYDKEKQEWLTAWADYLEHLVEPSETPQQQTDV
jgi:integrase